MTGIDAFQSIPSVTGLSAEIRCNSSLINSLVIRISIYPWAVFRGISLSMQIKVNPPTFALCGRFM